MWVEMDKPRALQQETGSLQQLWGLSWPPDSAIYMEKELTHTLQKAVPGVSHDQDPAVLRGFQEGAQPRPTCCLLEKT